MTDVKTNINLQTITNTKKYKSASLTFYSDELGYLLCDEFRYNAKNSSIHPLGGKVEDYDKNIYYTAIREFIEETNLESHPIINSEKNTKNVLINEFGKKIEKNTNHIDLCLKKDLNYYHRYYLVHINNITDIEFKKNIIELTKYFNGNYKTEINNLIWYKNDKNNENELDMKLSWLTKMFIKLFGKKKYIK